MKGEYFNIRKWEERWKGILPKLQEEQRLLLAFEEYGRDTAVLFLNWCFKKQFRKSILHDTIYYTNGKKYLMGYDLYEEFFKETQPAYVAKRNSYKFRMLLSPNKKANVDPIARFFDSVYPEPNTGCWLYSGEENEKGYGRFYLGGKRYQAHRYSWELHNDKKVPSGLVVCHKCNFPPCVNPEHLYAGTQKENAQQCVREGRNATHLIKRKRVSQYSRNGDYIATHSSMAEASTSVFGDNSKCKNISSNCLGHRKSAGGFIWKYAKT